MLREVPARRRGRVLAELVQRAADLRPVHERAVAPDAERDPRTPERLLERRRLGVDAVQHREIRPAPTFVGLTELRRDALRLRVAVRVRGDGRGGPRTARGPDVGALAPGEHRTRGLHDLGGGAVVHLEADDRAAAEVSVELREVARVGAGERVDRLVRVADDTQPVALGEPRPQQAQLRAADVLELVDEEMTEPPPLGGRELGVGLERLRREPDQIVEVDEAALALLLLVPAVHVGDAFERELRAAPGARGGLGVGGRTGQPRLRPLDLARDLEDRDLTVGAALADERREHARLAVQQLGHARPAVLVERAQLRERDGVERARGRVVPDPEPAEPAAQLARGLAGERERERVRGLDRLGAPTATRSGA